ncbi:hypothetical protein IW261DRAFT_1592227 [Armillaria novae-zelandiae]|uniref:Uncharacterized protein n=1 Tax=Armillaria novae-zelandiae TaxID=153914 RepID=A0AA39UAT2_9AGAR|nr:hypothetical protein IW261DRAFT_1592227 [Armillaria novae-zelandiae]
MGCIITALYIFSIVYVVASWIELRRAFVFATSFRARYDSWYSSLSWKIVSDAATALNLIIADCTIIWRCWSVWAHNWRVIILPVLFVIGEIVCGVNIVVHQLTVSFEDETQTHWAVAIMAATVGTNILCTTLIVARILHNARRNRGIMEGIRTYRGVLEIVVESAALHSIIFVALVISYPIKGNAYMYPQVLMFPITGIAPTLIILRVTSGQGRPKESSVQTQSSLRFQASRGSTMEPVMEGEEEDEVQGDTGGTAPMLFGCEQV